MAGVREEERIVPPAPRKRRRRQRQARLRVKNRRLLRARRGKETIPANIPIPEATQRHVRGGQRAAERVVSDSTTSGDRIPDRRRRVASIFQRAEREKASLRRDHSSSKDVRAAGRARAKRARAIAVQRARARKAGRLVVK